jgi:hypothetical protein
VDGDVGGVAVVCAVLGGVEISFAGRVWGTDGVHTKTRFFLRSNRGMARDLVRWYERVEMSW